MKTEIVEDYNNPLELDGHSEIQKLTKRKKIKFYSLILLYFGLSIISIIVL
jgi:hypothetical protein